MAAESYTSLVGNLKEVYSKKGLADAIPTSLWIQKNISYKAAQRTGKTYNTPVLTRYPTGASWTAVNAAPGTLNDVVNMQVQDAQIGGTSITNRDQIGYGIAAQATSDGPTSFKQTVALVVDALAAATGKFLELDFLYGGGSSPATGNSLGQVVTCVAVTATTTRVTFSYNTWAPGIFSGMEGASINFYNAGSLVSSGADSAFTVTSLNVVPASSTVGGSMVVTGTSSGSTTLVGLNGTTLDLYWKGAFGSTMSGIRQILTNTGSLFGIDASTASVWQANTLNCGSTQLTFGKVQQGVGLANSRGLAKDVVLLVSQATYANFNDEQSGARYYDTSYNDKEAKNGSRTVKYIGANGIIEVVAHPLVRQGEAYLFPVEETEVIGATDGVVMNLPGMNVDNFLVQVSNSDAFEVRNYVQQALLLRTPSWGTIFTNVVNA